MNNIDILEELLSTQKQYIEDKDYQKEHNINEEAIDYARRWAKAIETLIAENKELDKKDKVIDLIVNTIVGDRKILKLVCNKIINKKEDECFEQNILCDDCIKEYFYNKVEIPEEN